MINTSVVSSLYCQGLFNTGENEWQESIDFHGYIRGSAAGASEAFDISHAFSEFAIKPVYNRGNTYFFADLRFREGYAFNQAYSELEFKECYLEYKSSYADIFIGNQIISWGRNDGFNPTNKLTPHDYFFISSHPDDQKMSNFMLKSKFYISQEIDLECIGIPFYKPSVYRYELFLNEPSISFIDMALPDRKIKNASLGAHLNVELSALGFSFTYQSGYSNFYGFDIHSINWNQAGTPIIVNIPKTFKQQTWGTDFSVAIKNIILRGEAAYNYQDTNSDSIFAPGNDISYAASLETSFAGLRTIVQYIGKYTFDFADLDIPILSDPFDTIAQINYAINSIQYETALINRKVFEQQEESNHALALTLSRDLFYYVLYLEVTGYYNITAESYFIRPLVTWKINDQLSLRAGGLWMDGPENSLFSLSGPVLSHGIISLEAYF